VTLLGRFLNRIFGDKPKATNQPRLRSSYDAAQNTPTNRKHWTAADDYSANAAASPEVRRALRRRARYERDNDPHLNGLTKTLAHDLVGTGPRLQLGLGEEHYDAARLVEQSYAAWCRAVDLAEKLRLMHEARPTDGEAFGLFVTNPLVSHVVKLDLRVIEAEQVCTPDVDPLNPNAVDGIVFDRHGNPEFYHVLRQHPGDTYYSWTLEYDRVPARNVVHWFRPARPGQARGVSELASSLEIGAQTRRYSAAVLSAAEFAAMLAGVLEQEVPAGEVGVTSLEDWNEVEMTKGALLTLPKGTRASQFKPEQPITNYKDYVHEKRNEMARPTLAPFNVISGNSSGYNYSSGRLDHIPYHRIVWIERERMRSKVLDRLFLAWYAEAQLLGLIPDSLPAINEWIWEWQWDGFASIDPLKDTSAIELRLQLNLTTLAEECAAEGKDWREVLKQRAAEKAFMKELGLAESVPASPAQPFEEVPDDEE